MKHLLIASAVMLSAGMVRADYTVTPSKTESPAFIDVTEDVPSYPGRKITEVRTILESTEIENLQRKIDNAKAQIIIQNDIIVDSIAKQDKIHALHNETAAPAAAE